MPPRQPQPRRILPRLWLMTDERMGERLFDAIARLPRGSGIVFRHHGLEERERMALFRRIRRVTRGRHPIVVAGSARFALRAGADGVHLRSLHRTPPRLLRAVAVHDRRELIIASRTRADLVFVSPIFATRSHPEARALGRVRFGLLATRSPIPVIALGGMTRHRARGLRAFGIHGWAAIDALTMDSGRAARA